MAICGAVVELVLSPRGTEEKDLAHKLSRPAERCVRSGWPSDSLVKYKVENIGENKVFVILYSRYSRADLRCWDGGEVLQHNLPRFLFQDWSCLRSLREEDVYEFNLY